MLGLFSIQDSEFWILCEFAVCYYQAQGYKKGHFYLMKLRDSDIIMTE